ncbi:asparaginase [Rhodoplanes serenus]|uniref:asparaginase n=1 Tax=Rhodoplanes serenus TaxID=200615 RepID=UPI001FE0267A|nr:asparaginase [Rhodoplanes serenus]
MPMTAIRSLPPRPARRPTTRLGTLPLGAALAAAALMTALPVDRAGAQSAPASAPGSNQPVCTLVATGGTIAMKIDPVKQAPVPAISGDDLLATVPEVGKYARMEVKNISNVPSGYMDPPRWVALTKEVTAALERPEVSGVIVSHGTDTLEETAWWLDLTVQSDKPIILIGAQRNASEKDFDGPRNLTNAVRICVDAQAKGKGAMIALNDQINAARDVTKVHTSAVETFRSGDFGFLGVVDPDRVIFARSPARRQHVPLKADTMPPVEIVSMYGGADGRLVKAAVDQGAKGIVIEALGWGNVNPPMFAAIKEAIGKGVPVVISTRVPTGRVMPVYGFEGGGKTLADAGAIMADDLSPQKARILLMLLLQNGVSEGKAVQAAFSR